MQNELRLLGDAASNLSPMIGPGVRLVAYNEDGPIDVAAAMLFASSKAGLQELREYCRTLSEEKLMTILDAAAMFRENRRHKSPRALEQAWFTFEIVADFGIYRDLQRHRMLSQERQFLTCDLGYYIPSQLQELGLQSTYMEAMDRAKSAYEVIAAELPEEAQYVVPMAYHIHWYFHMNLRSLQWLCELRSMPSGHPSYRFIAQELAKQVCAIFPIFERFFKFVDFEGYELGRLGQEIRIAEKMQKK
jgi:hypothetical protein